MRYRDHLLLGIAGVVTALSLNIIYPTKSNHWDRLNEISILTEDYTWAINDMIEKSGVRDCRLIYESKTYPGAADFKILLNRPESTITALLYPFLNQKSASRKYIKSYTKSQISDRLYFWWEHTKESNCREKIVGLIKLIEEW